MQTPSNNFQFCITPFVFNNWHVSNLERIIYPARGCILAFSFYAVHGEMKEKHKRDDCKVCGRSIEGGKAACIVPWWESRRLTWKEAGLMTEMCFFKAVERDLSAIGSSEEYYPSLPPWYPFVQRAMPRIIISLRGRLAYRLACDLFRSWKKGF